jgi:putative flippase GtrA
MVYNLADMKRQIIALLSKHRQLVLYGIIGLSGATIDIAFYYIFYHFLKIPPVVASYLSVSMGIVNNFILNTRYNFKVRDHMLRRFGHFYAIGVGGAILSSALIYLFFNIMGLPPFISKVLTIVPVVLLQYFLNKRISFKDRSVPVA